MKRSLVWRRTLEVVAAVIVTGFVARYLAFHWREVRTHAWELSPVPLLAATLLAACALLLFGALWTLLLRGFGERVPLRQGLAIWFVSNLARYVPGKIWQISGTAYLARRAGLDPVRAVTSNLLFQGLVLAVAVLLLLATLPAELAVLYSAGGRAAFMLLDFVLLAFFLSPLFDRAFARALRVFKQPPPARSLSAVQKALFGAGTAVAWALYAISFWLFLRGTTAQAPSLLTSSGIFVGGYLAGFLAFFAPGGLGVREAVFTLLLGAHLSTSVALAIAVLSRLWLTAVEIALAGVVAALAGRGFAVAPPAGQSRESLRAPAELGTHADG